MRRTRGPANRGTRGSGAGQGLGQRPWEVSATVTRSCRPREVTLTLEDGEKFSLIADEAVENLDQASQGDVVVATYTEALADEVIKGG